MARSEKRTARKDYPESGIKAGEPYWYAKIKTGPRSSRVLRSKQPFKRSQLTVSDFKGQLYDWEDALAQLTAMDEAQQFADDIRALGEEQTGKFDNMPEGLQQGDSGQTLEARAAACEAAAEEIESAISDWESAKSTWESEIETYRADLAAYEAAQESEDPEAEEISEPDLPDNTLGEPDDPDAWEFDESEFLEAVQNVTVDE